MTQNEITQAILDHLAKLLEEMDELAPQIPVAWNNPKPNLLIEQYIEKRNMASDIAYLLALGIKTEAEIAMECWMEHISRASQAAINKILAERV